jgi:hypothetical protein
MAGGYFGDTDDLTIWSDAAPGHNQESRRANVREIRKRGCELNNANKLFRRKKR